MQLYVYYEYEYTEVSYMLEINLILQNLPPLNKI